MAELHMPTLDGLWRRYNTDALFHYRVRMALDLAGYNPDEDFASYQAAAVGAMWAITVMAFPIQLEN